MNLRHVTAWLYVTNVKHTNGRGWSMSEREGDRDRIALQIAGSVQVATEETVIYFRRVLIPCMYRTREMQHWRQEYYISCRLRILWIRCYLRDGYGACRMNLRRVTAWVYVTNYKHNGV